MHYIQIVIDRLTIKKVNSVRISESIHKSLLLSQGYVNIDVIDNNIIEFLSSYNTAYDDIYIKYDGEHYNIASLDLNYMFECCYINENMVKFSYVKHDYNIKISKFINSSVNLCL